MDLAIENKSSTREFEKAAENDVKDKTQYLETNEKSKCLDQIEGKSKDELKVTQSEYNENIENNYEAELNSETNIEAQNNILCSVSKDIVNGNKDNEDQRDKIDEKDSKEKSDNHSTLNQDSENMATEEIEDKNMRPTEESNDQSILDHGTDENKLSVQNTDQVSASSTQTQIREKCKYGSQCYRLNAEHKATFSHPGDTDYNDSDNRLECPYGVQCYRKNPQHKLDYKHTCTKRKRTQNPGQAVSLDDLSDFEDSMEESVDESEYDGSFIDDDDFESDFDSDQLDEENEDDEDSQKEKDKMNRKKRKQAKNDL